VEEEVEVAVAGDGQAEAVVAASVVLVVEVLAVVEPAVDGSFVARCESRLCVMGYELWVTSYDLCAH
jgi:hypothetical protein